MRAWIYAALLAVASSGCCSDVDETICFDWSKSTICPSREEAASGLHLTPEDEVTSDGVFWPSHEYSVDGKTIVAPAECCYDVTVTSCTTELH
jgi:hypothetical protein